MRSTNPKETTTAGCIKVTEVLGALGERWTVLTIRVLGQGSFRFNALRREIGDISPKMLASTLRNLERNGLVNRTVTPTNPPQVDYALTPLGESLQGPICAIAQWATAHASEVDTARRAYDARQEGDAGPTRLAAE